MRPQDPNVYTVIINRAAGRANFRHRTHQDCEGQRYFLQILSHTQQGFENYIQANPRFYTYDGPTFNLETAVWEKELL